MLLWRTERSFKHQSLNFIANNRKMGPRTGSNVRLKHRFKRKAPSFSLTGMVPGGAYRNRVYEKSTYLATIEYDALKRTEVRLLVRL
jgi:hypothetical protein